MEYIITANKNVHSKLNKLDINLYSPLSMTYALLLTYLGSSGSSLNVFENLFSFKRPIFGLGKVNKTEVVNDMTKLKAKFESATKSICKISNGVFVGNYPLVKSYVDLTKSLDLNVQTVDFTNPSTITDINKWIANNTNNLITQLLSSSDVDSNTKLILVNTLYFKGKWINKFNPRLTILNGIFNGQKATMMTEKDNNYYKYYDDVKQEVIELPYKDGFSMGIVLPKKNNIGYYDLETNIEQYFNNFITCKVYVTIPKFEQKIKTKYKQHAETLGISELFKKINLKELIDCNNSEMNISDVIQEVVVKVDEEGTEAAVATAVICKESCCAVVKPPIRFVADHTFVYYIKHDETNVIMFKGVLDKV